MCFADCQDQNKIIIKNKKIIWTNLSNFFIIIIVIIFLMQCAFFFNTAFFQSLWLLKFIIYLLDTGTYIHDT